MATNDIAVKRLGQLTDSIEELKKILKMSRDRVCNDDIKYAALERYLQVSIEHVLHVGNFVIASKGLKKPERYEDIMTILADEKIVPKKLSKDTARFATVRNSLVYDLEQFEREETYDLSKKGFLKTLSEIGKTLEKYVQ